MATSTNPAQAAYVNCAADYASQNATRIHLMEASHRLEGVLVFLELAMGENPAVAEEFAEHWQHADALRSAIEARLRA